ncbi:MAG: TIGR00266 family protein [Planctomycetes bacterium]|nr:TIGR00266 family protein [Planctomycetota bacterium]MBT6784956.1 TIGR00266 family protein [Planctomycetota bacterium]
MRFEILEQGAFQSALVHFDHGERLISESGAMVRASGNVDIDVTTRAKKGGGMLSGVKRLLGGDSFFLSTYSTTDGGSGEVGIAPILPGEVMTLEVAGAGHWKTTGGSFLAAGGDIELDMQFQGLGGFISGESLFFLEASGSGTILVGAFGALRELEVNGELTIDTGHLVAYEGSLDYSVTKAGGSWMQSFLAGEGFVMKFSGQGRVIVQTHDASGFGRRLGPLLPPRE